MSKPDSPDFVKGSYKKTIHGLNFVTAPAFEVQDDICVQPKMCLSVAVHLPIN